MAEISGRDLAQWMDTAWPGEEWYWDHDEFDPDPDPTAMYDTDDLGPLLYQGRGEDQTNGAGLDLGCLIEEWREKGPAVIITTMYDRANLGHDLDEVIRLGHLIEQKIFHIRFCDNSPEEMAQLLKHAECFLTAVRECGATATPRLSE